MLDRQQKRNRDNLESNGLKDILVSIETYINQYLSKSKIPKKHIATVRGIIAKLPTQDNILNTDNPLQIFATLIETIQLLLKLIPPKNSTELFTLLITNLQIQEECEWVTPDNIDITESQAIARAIDCLKNHAQYKSLAEKRYAHKWFTSNIDTNTQEIWKTILKESMDVRDENFTKFAVAISPFLKIKENAGILEIKYIHKAINTKEAPTYHDLTLLFFPDESTRHPIKDPEGVLMEHFDNLVKMGNILTMVTPRNLKILFFDILIDILIKKPELNSEKVKTLTKALAGALLLIEKEVACLEIFLKKQLNIIAGFVALKMNPPPGSVWDNFKRDLEFEMAKYHHPIDPTHDHNDFIHFVHQYPLEILDESAQYQELKDKLTYINRINGTVIAHNLPVDVVLPNIQKIKDDYLARKDQPTSTVLPSTSGVTSGENNSNRRAAVNPRNLTSPPSPSPRRRAPAGVIVINLYTPTPQEWLRAKKILVQIGIALVIGAALTGLAAGIIFGAPGVLAVIGAVGVICILAGIPVVSAVIGLIKGIFGSRRPQNNNALPPGPAYTPVSPEVTPRSSSRSPSLRRSGSNPRLFGSDTGDLTGSPNTKSLVLSASPSVQSRHNSPASTRNVIRH